MSHIPVHVSMSRLVPYLGITDLFMGLSYIVCFVIACQVCFNFIESAANETFTLFQSLLCDPNPNSPANSEAARMFSENKREYNRRVREIVEQSWTAD